MKNIIKSLMIAFAASALLAGCADKEEAATEVDPYATNFVYLSSPKSNSFRATFSNSGVWKLKPEETQVFTPVYCTKPANGDIKVSVKIDESLVAAYNAEHETEYEFLPEVVLAKNELVVKSGEYVSSDSLKLVHTDYDSIVEAGTKQYIVPVVVTEVSGKATLTETRPSVFYFFYDAAAIFAEITDKYTANMITDRSGWGIYEDNIGGYDMTKNLTDDSSYSDVTFYGGEVICIDLGQVYDNISNIGLRWYGDYMNYTPDDIIVEYSTDNADYTNLGTYVTRNYTPAVLDIYDPIKARYIKITLGEPSGWSIYMAEIYVGTAK